MVFVMASLSIPLAAMAQDKQVYRLQEELKYLERSMDAGEDGVVDRKPVKRRMVKSRAQVGAADTGQVEIRLSGIKKHKRPEGDDENDKLEAIDLNQLEKEKERP
jgi:hypothetical protein